VSQNCKVIADKWCKIWHEQHQFSGELKKKLRLALFVFPFYPYLRYKSFSMNYPENLRYTKDHEWIRLEGNIATIGITDFAQGELGDIVYVEVETIGKSLEAGAVFGTVEAVKTVSDLFLPVSGTITQLNPALSNTPELVNNDPYGEGWMVKMTVNNPEDVASLMDTIAYKAIVG
jgi:glycine cleavage system H protein